MALPANQTKVHFDAATDDPKQARAELAANVDLFNALNGHLGGIDIVAEALAIGEGLENNANTTLRVKKPVNSGLLRDGNGLALDFADLVVVTSIAGSDLIAVTLAGGASRVITRDNLIPATLPAQYGFGNEISNNGTDPVSDLDFGPGLWLSDDDTTILEAASGTRAIDAVFAEGGPGFRATADNLTGAKTFHLYVIGGAGKTDDYFASTSLTPTLPSGFTVKRRVFSLPWSGTAWELGSQRGNLFTKDARSLDDNTNNPGTLARTIGLGVPTGIVVDAIITHYGQNAGNVPGTFLATPLKVPDVAVSLSNFDIATSSNPNSGLWPQSVVKEIETDASGQIRVRASASNANTSQRVLTHAWRDRRGKS